MIEEGEDCIELGFVALIVDDADDADPGLEICGEGESESGPGAGINDLDILFLSEIRNRTKLISLSVFERVILNVRGHDYQLASFILVRQ